MDVYQSTEPDLGEDTTGEIPTHGHSTYSTCYPQVLGRVLEVYIKDIKYRILCEHSNILTEPQSYNPTQLMCRCDICNMYSVIHQMNPYHRTNFPGKAIVGGSENN